MSLYEAVEKGDVAEVERELAAGPKRARGDSGSVEQHSICEQIEADRYLASKDAVKNPTKGVRNKSRGAGHHPDAEARL